MTKSKIKKAKLISIISILSLLVVAALCFVFGYAMAEGWEAVGAWFTSKWAVLTVVALSVIAIAAMAIIPALKDKESFK